MPALIDVLVTFVVVTSGVILSALVLYQWVLALASLFPCKRQAVASAPLYRFAFVVPAHNEESGIAATVQSLLNVDYPRSLFEVVVVADNCSDSTAEMARGAGARCLERVDVSLRGKGYALRHAFAQLLAEEFEAFVVVDADSVVTANFLSVINARLGAGDQVIQSYYGVSNPDASIMTYLLQVGNLIENRLYWEAKQLLGLPIFLRGNGMCFRKDVLQRYPWGAFTITEDTEYGLMLVANGIPVQFAPEIGVYAYQPETLEQAFAQRVRWAAGNASLTKGKAAELIWSGLVGKDLSSFDLGISLVAGSRPLMLISNVALAGICGILKKPGLLTWAGIIFIGQLSYIGLGVALNGLSVQKMYRLFLSPIYLLWLCFISILGAAGFRKNQWVRTKRT